MTTPLSSVRRRIWQLLSSDCDLDAYLVLDKPEWCEARKLRLRDLFGCFCEYACPQEDFALVLAFDATVTPIHPTTPSGDISLVLALDTAVIAVRGGDIALELALDTAVMAVRGGDIALELALDTAVMAGLGGDLALELALDGKGNPVRAGDVALVLALTAIGTPNRAGDLALVLAVDIGTGGATAFRGGDLGLELALDTDEMFVHFTSEDADLGLILAFDADVITPPITDCTFCDVDPGETLFVHVSGFAGSTPCDCTTLNGSWECTRYLGDFCVWQGTWIDWCDSTDSAVRWNIERSAGDQWTVRLEGNNTGGNWARFVVSTDPGNCSLPIDVPYFDASTCDTIPSNITISTT